MKMPINKVGVKKTEVVEGKEVHFEYEELRAPKRLFIFEPSYFELGDSSSTITPCFSDVPNLQAYRTCPFLWRKKAY